VVRCADAEAASHRIFVAARAMSARADMFVALQQVVAARWQT
jgi:hypothetical protein